MKITSNEHTLEVALALFDSVELLPLIEAQARAAGFERIARGVDTLCVAREELCRNDVDAEDYATFEDYWTPRMTCLVSALRGLLDSQRIPHTWVVSYGAPEITDGPYDADGNCRRCGGGPVSGTLCECDPGDAIDAAELRLEDR